MVYAPRDINLPRIIGTGLLVLHAEIIARFAERPVLRKIINIQEVVSRADNKQVGLTVLTFNILKALSH